MPQPWNSWKKVTKRAVSLAANSLALRYGVAGLIVIALGIFLFDVAPVLRRDLTLVRKVYGVDQQGIRIESDLQTQLQENRSEFLRVLLAAGDPAEREQRRQSLRGHDAAIANAEDRLASLDGSGKQLQGQFHDRWTQYVTLRDKALAAGTVAAPKSIQTTTLEACEAAFHSAMESARQAQQAYFQMSGNDLIEATNSLQGFLRKMFLLLCAKVAILGLLVWVDWRRVVTLQQLHQANADLRVRGRLLQQTYDEAVVGMGTFTLDGTVLSLNAKAAQILGYHQSELIGAKVSSIMAPEHVEDHLNRLATTPQLEDGSYRAERRVIRKDGTEAWVRNTVTLMKPEGMEPYYFSTSEEITQQRKATERLAYLANYDPVTNLPNRRCFEEQMTQAMEAGAGGCVALLYLEIDSFDFLKSTFGPRVADDVLSDFGESLAGLRRADELIGRIDDHAFGLMTHAAAYDPATLRRADELQEIGRKFGSSGRYRIPVSASIGVAFSTDGELPGSRRSSTRETATESLLKFARAAMLEARSRGGDCVCIADPSLQARAAQRHQIESALLQGIRDHEFQLVFQPQFQIADRKLVRFETLCRWHSSELGTVPPDRFIPIAEHTGLIAEMGRRILHEALCQAKTWSNSGRRIGLSVNVSPMQFMRPDFTQSVAEALHAADFAPELLELEVTEGIFIRDLNLAITRIRELQHLGLRVALDDFGTGYSSLSYLQRMPIDAVKLDRSFVNDITTNPATESMVQSVLAMAKALRLRVITEGVETEQQFELLRRLGCDEAQGYLLGRPESAEMALKRVLETPI